MANLGQIRGAQELPIKLEALQNGRWRATRRVQFQSALNVDDSMFPALGTHLAAEYVVNGNEAKFANLVLVGVGFEADVVNRASACVLAMVYETVTDVWVDEVDEEEDTELNGLLRRTKVQVAHVGTADDTVVGVTTDGGLYLASKKLEKTDGMWRRRLVFLQAGVVSRTVRLVDEGLREETIQAFHTRVAPAAGIVVYDREENELGFPVWTVTAMQNRSGGDPTSGTAESYSQLVEFSYPGRAKLFTQPLLTVFNFIDLYMSPPIDAILPATVTVTYANTSTAPTLTHTLWNPTQWAVLNSVFLVEDAVNGGRSKVEGLRGYRVDESVSNPQTLPIASAVGDVDVAFGQVILNTYGGSATLSGGPPNPGGSTWTLRWSVAPAFVGTDGTQFYKKTVVTCAVPTQPALPV